jgi:hypothetical protein
MFNRKIFRDKSLERLSSPEELDIPLKILNIKSWLLFMLLFAVMASVFLWVGFSNVNQEIECRGIIVKEDHLTEVLALRAGFVDKVLISQEDSVKKGDVLFNLVSADDKQKIMEIENNISEGDKREQVNIEEILKKSAVWSPVNGVLFELSVSDGYFVNIGDKLLTLESEISPGTHDEFEVIGFVPGRMINTINEGTSVLIAPKNIDIKEYGYLMGIIKRIAGYPVSQERIEMLTKRNPGILEDIQEKIFEVTIIPDKINGQLKWSSDKSPGIRFINGTSCDLKIVSSSRNLFSYIVH